MNNTFSSVLVFIFHMLTQLAFFTIRTFTKFTLISDFFMNAFNMSLQGGHTWKWFGTMGTNIRLLMDTLEIK